MCYNKGRLQAYLDGELSAREMEQIREHIAACEECNRILRELESNAAFVETSIGAYIDAITAPGDTVAAWKRFQDRKALGGRMPAAIGSGRGFRFAAVAASFILIFIVATSMLKTTGLKEQISPKADKPAETTQEYGRDREEPPAVFKSGGLPNKSAATEEGREFGETLNQTGDSEEGPAAITGGQTVPAQPVPGTNDAGEQFGLGSLSDGSKVETGGDADTKRLAQSLPEEAALHAPVAPASVHEVSIRVAEKQPVIITGDESKRVLEWFNKGTSAGAAQSYSAFDSVPGGPQLCITLSDAKIITVSGVDPVQVEVCRGGSVYRLNAPELAAYIRQKGGEIVAGTAE
ncbi:MAG: zf-HC2 domain-containing protein [Bacillota bacterium]